MTQSCIKDCISLFHPYVLHISLSSFSCISSKFDFVEASRQRGRCRSHLQQRRSLPIALQMACVCTWASLGYSGAASFPIRMIDLALDDRASVATRCVALIGGLPAYSCCSRTCVGRRSSDVSTRCPYSSLLTGHKKLTKKRRLIFLLYVRMNRIDCPCERYNCMW